MRFFDINQTVKKKSKNTVAMDLFIACFGLLKRKRSSTLNVKKESKRKRLIENGAHLRFKNYAQKKAMTLQGW
tara:strand:- start:288 stop:506 length:219 start_codon:yes stop_codon:yes gene_type:complete